MPPTSGWNLGFGHELGRPELIGAAEPWCFGLVVAGESCVAALGVDAAARERAHRMDLVAGFAVSRQPWEHKQLLSRGPRALRVLLGLRRHWGGWWPGESRSGRPVVGSQGPLQAYLQGPDAGSAICRIESSHQDPGRTATVITDY